MEESNLQDDFVNELIAESLLGEIDAKNLVLLNKWRKQSAYNESQYQSYLKIQENLDILVLRQNIDENTSWQQLSAKMDEVAGREHSEPSVSKNYYFLLVRWTAVAAALVGIFIMLFNQFDFNEQTIKTAKGVHKRIELPDGSFLALNENTEITFNEKVFSKLRTIVLKSGEIYLDVKHDENRPFKIETSLGIVEDLGTSFYLRKDENELSVKVASGSVALIANGNSKVILPGKQGVIVDGKTILLDSPAVFNKELNWMKAGLNFNNASLNTVVLKLSEVFSRPIEIRDASLKDRTLTASLSYSSIDSALNVISAALQVKVSKSKKGYIITR